MLAYNPTALGSDGTLTSVNLQVERVPVSQNQRALEEAGAYELDRMIDHIDPTITIHEGGYLAWGPRTPLSLAVSFDDGETWQDALVLESDPGEFSYPSIIKGKHDLVHISYTHNRKGIKYVRLTASEIQGK